MSEEKKTPTKETKTKTKAEPAKKAEAKPAKKVEPKVAEKTEKVTKTKKAEPKKVEKTEKIEKAEQPEKVEKAEETPAKKEKNKKSHKGAIITWSIIGGILVAGGITCAIVLPIVLNQVNYREAYTISKDLKSNIRDFYYYYDDCLDVVEEVDDDWYSTSTYDGYVKECKDAIKTETIQKVESLKNTSAVQKNETIKAKFDAFNSEFSKSVEGIDDSTSDKLDTYAKWHKFIYEADVSFSSVTEEKLNTIAGYAKDTGIDEFKTYGENWLEKAKEVRKSYKDDKYSVYYTKYNDFEDWVEKNQPNIKELIPLPFNEDNSRTVYDAFDELREAIAEEYSKNYDGSGECTKVPYINTVVCE